MLPVRFSTTLRDAWITYLPKSGIILVERANQRTRGYWRLHGCSHRAFMNILRRHMTAGKRLVTLMRQKWGRPRRFCGWALTLTSLGGYSELELELHSWQATCMPLTMAVRRLRAFAKRLAERAGRRLALAMAFHARLGAAALLRALPPELVASLICNERL